MKKSLLLRLLSNFSGLAKKSQIAAICSAQKLTLVRTKASAETMDKALEELSQKILNPKNTAQTEQTNVQEVA